MAFKRRGEPATIDDEREALRAQHAALEDLKRQLAERVEAVRERELELHHALTEASRPLSETRRAPPQVLPTRVLDGAGADTDEDVLAAERRERAVAEREQAVAAGEARLGERERVLELRTGELAEEKSELQLRAERAAGATAAPILPAPAPDAARLAQIEARLAELRDAERLFLRTRQELADRSEAVAARERLVAQKERELDDREDGVGRWGGPELSEVEARLRRLEQQPPGEQTLGFSGGLRKLQQGTTRSHRDA